MGEGGACRLTIGELVPIHDQDEGFCWGIGHGAAAALLAGALAAAALVAGGLAAGDADAKRGPQCANARTDPGNLNAREAEKAIRCLINERRDEHGVGNLAANGRLGNAAQDHTDHMVKHGCFAHVCPGERGHEHAGQADRLPQRRPILGDRREHRQCPAESGMSTRIKRTGYLNGARSWGLGENVATGDGGRGSPAEMVDAWMNSPPHRAAILDGAFEHVGVGMEHGTPANPNGDGATYTSDFGRKGG